MTRLHTTAFILAVVAAVGGATRPSAQRSARQAAPERSSILDNSTVGVTKLHLAAGAFEATRTHGFPVLLVQLTRGEVTVVERGVRRIGNHAGEIWFVPANTPHRITNSGRVDTDLVAVAIKPDRETAGAAPATQAPPGITRTTLMDNDTLRVVRVRFTPEGREPMHTHPNDLLTIQLTAGTVEIVNGSDRSIAPRGAGFVQFLPRNVSHAYANAGSMPFDLLSVSIK